MRPISFLTMSTLAASLSRCKQMAAKLFFQVCLLTLRLYTSKLTNTNIGPQKVDLWATGRRYTKGKGSSASGTVTDRVPKPKELLDSKGKLFTKSRPQYENESAGSFLAATQNGCDNGGGGDQTKAIHSFLEKALHEGKIAYFPAGIYSVSGTVEMPTNSRVVGAS